MKTLILVRHAKSDWPEDTDDFDRPLAERGMHDAELFRTETKMILPIRAFGDAVLRRAQSFLLHSNHHCNP